MTSTMVRTLAGSRTVSSTDRERAVPAPFLKWAGGKRSLVPALLPLLPRSIKTYYEPFLGGGALFFALAERGLFRRAVLADRNEELINCYSEIRRDWRAVMQGLTVWTYDEETYYRVRELSPFDLPPSSRAARTLFLNRCGYNGLYRVNRDGRFNVPFGRFSSPPTFQTARLEAVAAALKHAELLVSDFASVAERSGPDDFVYFDPPYVPVSPTASFTAYGAGGFGVADQQRLATLLRQLGERRVPALLSNSDCVLTRTLYRGLRPRSVEVRRAINSNGAKRGPVSELLVRSFAYPLRGKR